MNSAITDSMENSKELAASSLNFALYRLQEQERFADRIDDRTSKTLGFAITISGVVGLIMSISKYEIGRLGKPVPATIVIALACLLVGVFICFVVVARARYTGSIAGEVSPASLVFNDRTACSKISRSYRLNLRIVERKFRAMSIALFLLCAMAILVFFLIAAITFV